MARPLRGRLALSALLGLAIVAASLGFVWISKRVIDSATGVSGIPLDRNITIMAAIMLAQVLLRVAFAYQQGKLVLHASNSNRASVFEKVMRSSWSGMERFHSGDVLNRLEEDVRVTVEFVCVSFVDCVITLTQLVAATVFLFMLSSSLGWILVFIMPVAVVGSRLFFRKMRQLTGEIRAVDSSVQSHMQENFQHRVVVKTLGAVGKVLSRLGFLQDDLERKTVRRLGYGAVSRGFLSLGFSAGYAVAFFWGAYGISKGTVTYGLMVAFLQLVGQIQRPVADIARHIPAFIRALSSEERLMELCELDQETENGDVAIEGAPGVRVENLTFRYEGKSEPVFKDLSFDFKPGEMTAILGSTGAGKSTLVRVIMALLKPESGRVVLYDPEVESSPDTRCNFMYVPQGNSLMSGTIRENLLLAKADASDEELRVALESAAADFVFSLEKGLDTSCAEIGAGLSEGQAQRIAIARALLRPGGILVLDEATSALDADTELELLTRLNRRCNGTKTIICITHRPAATSFADAVLKL